MIVDEMVRPAEVTIVDGNWAVIPRFSRADARDALRVVLERPLGRDEAERYDRDHWGLLPGQRSYADDRFTVGDDPGDGAE